MAQQQALSPTQLTWVREPLSELLKQVRLALETQDDDAGNVNFSGALQHLSQLAATLRMLSIDGAAHAIEEMHALVDDLSSGKVADPEQEALGTLLGGTVVVDDYLDRLQIGQSDLPLVLLPLVNDIRAARSKSLLPEGAFFKPELIAELPPIPLFADRMEERELSRLRQLYQTALRNWLRVEKNETPLRRLMVICDALAEAAPEIPEQRMWRVAVVAIYGFLAGHVHAGIGIKRILVRLDLHLKRLADGSADRNKLVEESDLLTRSLLFYLAMAEPGNAAVQAVADHYRLVELLPDRTVLDQAWGSVRGRNREVFESVTKGVLEELLNVKDVLDLQMRAAAIDPGAIGPLGVTLNNAANTLEMLNVASAAELVRGESERLETLVQTPEKMDQEALIDVATSLLQVEAHIQRAADAMGEVERERPMNQSGLGGHEFNKVVGTLLSHTLDNLHLAQQQLEQWLIGAADSNTGQSILRLLEESSGAVQMLEQQEVSSLLLQSANYLRNELIEAPERPSDDDITSYADALAALEIFLTSLRDNQGLREDLLQRAGLKLTELGYGVEQLQRAQAEAAAAAEAATQAAAQAEAEAEAKRQQQAAAEAAAKAAAEEPNLQLVSNEPKADDTPTESKPSGLSELSLEPVEPKVEETELEESQASPAAPPSAGLSLVDIEGDTPSAPEPTPADVEATPAKEELTLEAPTEALPAEPTADLNDGLQLVDFDGAAGLPADESAPAEASASSSVPTAAPNDFVSSSDVTDNEAPAISLVPGRQDDAQPSEVPPQEPMELSTETPTVETHSNDLDGLVEAADMLAPEAEIPERTEVEDDAAAAPVKPAAEAEPVPDIDPEFLEIFLEEFEAEQADLSTAVPKLQENPYDRDLFTDVRRSFHTLKGSGRMVGAMEIGEFAWEIESMLNRVLDGQLSMSQAMPVVAEAVALLPALRERLIGQGEAATAEQAKAIAQTAIGLTNPVSTVEPEEAPEDQILDTAATDTSDHSAETTEPELIGTEDMVDLADDAGLPAVDAAEPETLTAAPEPNVESTPTDEPEITPASTSLSLENLELEATEEPEMSLEDELSLVMDDAATDDSVAEAPVSDDEPKLSLDDLALEPTDATDPMAVTEADGLSLEESLNEAVEAQTSEPDVVEPPTVEEPAVEELAEVASAEPEVSTEAAELPEEALIDPTLVELIRTELGEHLSTIQSYLDDSEYRGWAEVPGEGLVRAIHTIAGNLGLANHLQDTESLHAVERYMRELGAMRKPPELSGLQLLKATALLTRQRLERLNKANMAVTDIDVTALGQQAQTLLDQLYRQLEAELAEQSRSVKAPLDGSTLETPESEDSTELTLEPTEAPSSQGLSLESVADEGSSDIEVPLDDVTLETTADHSAPEINVETSIGEAPAAADTNTQSPVEAAPQSEAPKASEPELGAFDLEPFGSFDDSGATVDDDPWADSFELNAPQETSSDSSADETTASDTEETFDTAGDWLNESDLAALVGEDDTDEENAEPVTDSTENDVVETIDFSDDSLPPMEAPESAEPSSSVVDLGQYRNRGQSEEAPTMAPVIDDSSESLAPEADDVIASDKELIDDEQTIELGNDDLDAALEALDAESDANSLIESVSDTPEVTEISDSDLDSLDQIADELGVSDSDFETESTVTELDAAESETIDSDTPELEPNEPPALDDDAAAFAKETTAQLMAMAHEETEASQDAEPKLSEPETAEQTEVAPAAPEAPAEAAVQLVDVNYGALDADLLDIFLEESEEILEGMDNSLQEWRDSQEVTSLNELKRQLHTLKGGARMAGLDPIGELGHELETMLELSAPTGYAGADMETIQFGCDELHGMLEAAYKRNAIPASRLLAGDMSAGPATAPVEDTAPAVAAASEAPAEAPKPAAPTLPDAPEEAKSATEIAATEGRAPNTEVIRVNAVLLDNLVNFAGEISIFRSRIEQEVGSIRTHVAEVDETVQRLREQLRKLELETEAQILSRFQREQDAPGHEFDPLELDRYSTIQQLSRALAESVNDLISLQEVLDTASSNSETLLLQQSRVNTELQEGLMQTRLVPFASLAPRLRRVVRRAAGESDKKARVELDFLGGEGLLDRNVLDRITAPLEHMLRNSIVHGIELPSERRGSGKDEEGVITISVDREATELLIRVRDDGRGINPEKIHKRAIELGLTTPQAQLTVNEVLSFIFSSGFSTASELTELAGRGVGMDVVGNEVRQLGGSIDIHTEIGKGTQFDIRIPLSLAVMQAIMVRAGERSYAIPLTSVRGVAKMPIKEYLEAVDSTQPVFEYGGREYPILELEPQLGLESLGVPDVSVPLLMIEAGESRAALRVAELQNHREIVVKPVGPQISSIPGILGGTITGDGQVVIILDMGPLIRRGLSENRLPGVQMEYMSENLQEQRRTPTVMVVDDSITMRKVTSRVLENRKLEVMTARDGLDAVEIMYDRIPDLILLDIEMPRMDGYELASHVRNDPRLRHIPMMIISSRTGEKHRQRGDEVGVDRYLGKPYREPELIKNVFELLEMEQPED
jgi:chemosensory pili system protein ChpA (sensor histidine kinase/response regulator)